MSKIRKTGQRTPGPFKKGDHRNPLISAMVDAFRGHGFSLLVTAFLRGLQLMLFPPKSPPALQSTSVNFSIISTNSIFSDNHWNRERYKASRNTSSTLFLKRERLVQKYQNFSVQMQTTEFFYYLKSSDFLHSLLFKLCFLI